MKKELVAIAFSDLHLNLWAKFNEDGMRTEKAFDILEYIAGISHRREIPVLFCGDMFHKPETLDQDLALRTKQAFNLIYRKYPRCKIFAIEGNHDLKHTNTWPNLTKGWLSFFENDTNLVVLTPNTPPAIIGLDVLVYGIPYIDHNINISDIISKLNKPEGFQRILLLHTDYPGAKDTDGRRVDSVENLNINLLNKFDLVLCGHIHKPQRLSKKVYMLGATNQQRRTDRDCDMGYWEIYQSKDKKLSVKFIPLEGFPKFIDVESSDDIKDDGNYYTVLPKKVELQEVKHKIDKSMSKKVIAKKYLKTKGIGDKGKKKLLIKILNEVSEC